MRQEYRDEIVELASTERKIGAEDAGQQGLSETDREFEEAIDDFYAVARRAVTIYNEASGGVKLALNRLTPEFLDLLLNIPGRRGGFSIISPYGIVILFDEDPYTLTVIGKKRQSGGGPGGELSPAVKLLKVNFDKQGEEVRYRDNTGGSVEPDALVTLFVKWVTSA